MRNSMKKIIVLITLVLLASCGSNETLLRKSAVAPPEMTLTGQWELIEDIDTVLEDFDRAIRQTSGKASSGIQNSQSSRKIRSREKVGGLVHVFLENGKNLKITQVESGLFISFDRSVVEEYRFGEVRLMNIGGAQAQRVSGWEGEDYVVETLGKEGMKLTERYHLIESESRLYRQVILRSKKGETVVTDLTYRRKSG
jgi:hypothetical protein